MHLLFLLSLFIHLSLPFPARGPVGGRQDPPAGTPAGQPAVVTPIQYPFVTETISTKTLTAYLTWKASYATVDSSE